MDGRPANKACLEWPDFVSCLERLVEFGQLPELNWSLDSLGSYIWRLHDKKTKSICTKGILHVLRRHIRYNTSRPKGLMGSITVRALETSFSILAPSFLADLYHYGNRRFVRTKHLPFTPFHWTLVKIATCLAILTLFQDFRMTATSVDNKGNRFVYQNKKIYDLFLYNHSRNLFGKVQ